MTRIDMYGAAERAEDYRKSMTCGVLL
jgi:hypothetical protein